MRPIILKLATKISLECGTYTGITENDPEYKILDPVLTDEMAQVAMGLKVRRFVSAQEVAARVHKPLERVTEILYELGELGVCRYAKKGDIDMFRVLRQLNDSSFDGVLIPDHTPLMTCDAPWHAGMAYALGYMRAAFQLLEKGINF